MTCKKVQPAASFKGKRAEFPDFVVQQVGNLITKPAPEMQVPPSRFNTVDDHYMVMEFRSTRLPRGDLS